MITRTGDAVVHADPTQLQTGETVCPVHHTAYHSALGQCPDCFDDAWRQG